MSDEVKAEEGAELEGEAAEGSEGAEGAELDGKQEAAEGRIPQERLDREVGRRKETEERLYATEAERDAAKARLAEVEDAAAAGIPLYPDYLTREERALVVQANELEKEEIRLESAEGGIEDDPKLDTPAKVRTRLAEVRQSLRRIGAKANAAYERGKQQQMADLKAVRELRLAREKAAKSAERGGKKEEGRPGVSLAGAGTGAPGGGSERKKRGPDETRFEKAGGTLSAAARELAEMIPD